MKMNVPVVVFSDDIVECNDFATANMDVLEGSCYLVQMIGSKDGVMDTCSDLGKVYPFGVLERRITIGYKDVASTDDITEWAPVSVNGCQVGVSHKSNSLVLVTPGTYRIRFNVPDYNRCVTLYYERMSVTNVMIHSDTTKF